MIMNDRKQRKQYKELAKKAHQINRENGFWDTYDKLQKDLENAQRSGKKGAVSYIQELQTTWIATQVALIGTEITELDLAPNYDNFKEELADIVIRTLDLDQGLNMDLDIIEINDPIPSEKAIILYRQLNKGLEYLRNDDISSFKFCLESLLVRVRKIASLNDIDLIQEIKNKIEINRTRDYKHGKMF